MDNKTYKIGDFVFEDETTAKEALKEQKAIEYIITQMDTDNPKVVQKVYNQLVEQNIFHTQLGLAFLEQLKLSLNETDQVTTSKKTSKKQKEPKKKKEKVNTTKANSKTKAKKDSVEFYKGLSEFFIFTTIVLAICVVVMLFIGSTSNSPNIINYENQLINKYESWEMELNNREKAILDKEKELGIN